MFESGALNEVSGTIALGGTWAEDIYFTQAGQPMDLTGLSFKMTFRACGAGRSEYGWGWSYYCSSPDLVLSTDDGSLAVTDDPDGNHRVLSISKAAGSFTRYGDFICDLASRDLQGVITPIAHGRVTFRNNPPAWG